MRRSLYLGDTTYEVIAEPHYAVSSSRFSVTLTSLSYFQEETNVFAGLVQAMYDTNTVAIVRRCFSERSSPEIGFLRPHIAHDHIVSSMETFASMDELCS